MSARQIDFLTPDTISEFDTMVWCPKSSPNRKPTIYRNVFYGHFGPTPICIDINLEIRGCINFARSLYTFVAILRAEYQKRLRDTLMDKQELNRRSAIKRMIAGIGVVGSAGIMGADCPPQMFLKNTASNFQPGKKLRTRQSLCCSEAVQLLYPHPST